MELKLDSPMEEYLKCTREIDFDHPLLAELIADFSKKKLNELTLIKTVFEFVRDLIHHSFDAHDPRMTRTASETYEKRVGICYSKSLLLAALLRGLGIPCGFSYQKVTLHEDPEQGMCIHALNTVFIKNMNKWIRVDARGNKAGINAQFSLMQEQIAFKVRPELGEMDYPTNYALPHPLILATLSHYDDAMKMYNEGLPKDLD